MCENWISKVLCLPPSNGLKIATALGLKQIMLKVLFNDTAQSDLNWSSAFNTWLTQWYCNLLHTYTFLDKNYIKLCHCKNSDELIYDYNKSIRK